MNTTIMSKTLIFEGAGWDSAPCADVGNCRIRTRIKNNDGDLVYLEINGFESSKYTKRPFQFTGYVMHCFGFDCNESSPLRKLEHECFEYSSKSLLDWVNEKLNCSFRHLSIVNDGSVRVHDTVMPLCECVEFQDCEQTQGSFNRTV